MGQQHFASRTISRRQWIQAAGLSGAAVWLGGRAGWAADAPAVMAGKDLLVHGDAPWNAEPRLEKLVQNWLTPNQYFYVRSHAAVPQVALADYTVEVSGLVEHPLRLSLAELTKKFPAQTIEATLTCAGNRREEMARIKPISGVQWQAGAIGNARWGGVRLSDVLRAAGIKPEAKHVWFEGLDPVEHNGHAEPFGGSIPLEKALAETPLPGALLASSMNGAPLAPEHGYPLRAVVPGFIGARSVKWLAKIIVSDRPSTNHFLADAYKLVTQSDKTSLESAAPLYEYALNSAICVPQAGASVAAGSLKVQGYALPSGKPDTTIKRVELSTNAGQSWTAAQLSNPARPFCWTLWQANVQLTPGVEALLVRATDSSGATQPARQVWNLKGYNHNAWYKTPLTVDS